MRQNHRAPLAPSATKPAPVKGPREVGKCSKAAPSRQRAVSGVRLVKKMKPGDQEVAGQARWTGEVGGRLTSKGDVKSTGSDSCGTWPVIGVTWARDQAERSPGPHR